LNDAVFTSIPLLKWLDESQKVKRQGGASVLVPLLYAKNSTFKAYSKDDTLDVSGQEGLTLSQGKWVNYGGTITVFGDELRQNSGEGKLFDLIKAKTIQSVMSGRDALSIDLWSSGGINTKKIIPIDNMVDTTSTVQDINSTSNSWWQAQSIASGSFAGRGLQDMRNLRDTIVKQAQFGASLPDLYLTTQTIFELYEQSQAPQIRYGPRDNADGTFGELFFQGGKVVFDPNCISGNLYALSKDALQFVVHSDADWVVGEFREPVDQDMRTAKVIIMCQLMSVNRRRLGKLTSVTA